MGDDCEYKERLVCFIDILGFKGIVNATVDESGADNVDNIQSIIDMFKAADHFVKPSPYDEEEADVKVTRFSDSIVLSFDYEAESQLFYRILSIQWMLINFAFKGFICRGGIAKGKIYHTDNMVFGPAMNEAYRLESEKAKNPRVILSDDIVKLAGSAKAKNHTFDEEVEYVEGLLEKDDDEYYYVNYVGPSVMSELDDPEIDYLLLLDSVRSILEKMRDVKSESERERESVRKKYEWLRGKYNNVVGMFLQAVENDQLNTEDSDVFDAYGSLRLVI